MTLYELNIQMQEILNMAESGEFDEDVIKGSLECVEGEIEAKMDSYGVIVNELLNDIENIDKEIKRLTAKKKTLTGSVDYMKKNVRETMERMEKKTIKGDRFTWSIQKNGGKAPLIFENWFDALALPEEYQDWEVRPDKDAIRKALEKGVDIEGVTIGERGDSLRLK